MFWTPCLASTDLAGGEAAQLSALPAVVEAPPPAVRCELVHGHDGRHVAFILSACGGDRWWWLRWTADHRELVEIDPCEEIHHGSELPEECMLPRRHHGPHSYDITTRTGPRLTS